MFSAEMALSFTCSQDLHTFHDSFVSTFWPELAIVPHVWLIPDARLHLLQLLIPGGLVADEAVRIYMRSVQQVPLVAVSLWMTLSDLAVKQQRDERRPKHVPQRRKR